MKRGELLGHEVVPLSKKIITIWVIVAVSVVCIVTPIFRVENVHSGWLGYFATMISSMITGSFTLLGIGIGLSHQQKVDSRQVQNTLQNQLRLITSDLEETKVILEVMRFDALAYQHLDMNLWYDLRAHLVTIPDEQFQALNKAYTHIRALSKRQGRVTSQSENKVQPGQIQLIEEATRLIDKALKSISPSSI